MSETTELCFSVAVIANFDFINHRENYKRSVWVPVQYNGHLQEIKFNHPAFYPLCYPLLHLLGESGWHVDLKQSHIIGLLQVYITS